MKAQILLLYFLIGLSVSSVAADNRYWVATNPGNWNNAANWSTTSGGTGGASVPGSSDVAIFDGGPNGLHNANCSIVSGVDVNGIYVDGFEAEIHHIGGNIDVGSAGWEMFDSRFLGSNSANDHITVLGPIAIYYNSWFTSTKGTLDLQGDMVALGANRDFFHPLTSNVIINYTIFHHNNGTVKFSGSQAQTLSLPDESPNQSSRGELKFYVLQINKTINDLTSLCDLHIEEELKLSGKNIVLQKGNLTMGIGSSITGAGTASYIVTTDKWEFRQRFDASYFAPSNIEMLFPIGDPSNYSPFKMTISGGEYSSQSRIGCNVTATAEPNILLLGPSNYITRYWTVSEFQFIQDVPSEFYDVEYTYPISDVIGIEASLRGAHRDHSNSQLTRLFNAPVSQTITITDLQHSEPFDDDMGIYTASDVCEINLDIENSTFHVNAICDPPNNTATLETVFDPCQGCTYNYSWTSAGPILGGGTNSIITGTPGPHSVTVTQTNQNQCLGIASVELEADIPTNNTINPMAYWTFEAPNTLGGAANSQSVVSSHNLDIFSDPNNQSGIITTTGGNWNSAPVGNYLKILAGDYALLTGSNKIDFNSYDAVTFECIFRLDGAFTGGQIFGGRSHNNEAPLTINLQPDKLDVFSYTITGSVNSATPRVTIPLTGIGRRYFGYYLDDQWHHIAVTVNKVTGDIKVWVDGQSPDGFSSSGALCGEFQDNATDYLGNYTPVVPTSKAIGDLDEIVIFGESLSETMIYQHYSDALLQGDHYVFTNTTSPCELPVLDPIIGQIDPYEYPTGHPTPANIDMPLDQLRSFPFPRYQPDHTLLRNNPWFSYSFLAGGGVSLFDGQDCYDLMEEIAEHWHSYIQYHNLQGLTSPNSLDAFMSAGNVNNATNANQVMVMLSNNRPDLASSVNNFWIQSNPNSLNSAMHFGGIDDIPFMQRLNLSNAHYDDFSGTNYWLPGAPHDEVKIDGEVGRYYFSNLYNYLNKPVDFISENGEMNHPKVVCQNTNNPIFSGNTNNLKGIWAGGQNTIPACDCAHPSIIDCEWKAYTSAHRHLFRKTFSDEFMLMPQHITNNTIFNWYSVDGVNGHSTVKYHYARPINIHNGNSYATPDLYPGKISNWYVFAQADKHGMGWIEAARKVELEEGDKLFSPFTGAGWQNDPEVHIRPGQWLGLMKILGVYGAEYYHPSHFSLVSGNQPDPRHWAWQSIITSYAQAITSRYEDILRTGDLIDGQNGQPIFDHYDGIFMDRLALRKLDFQSGKKYVISGTRQTLTNMAGAAPLVDVSTFKIPTEPNDEELTLEIRRQGSTYIYDKSLEETNEFLFYQLDGWHEYKHPQHWSRDFVFEAEVYDEIKQESGNIVSGNAKYLTRRTFLIDGNNQETTINIEVSAQNFPLDFTNYVTFMNFPSANPESPESWNMGEERPYSEYIFRQMNKDLVVESYDLFVKARIKQNLAENASSGFDIMLFNQATGDLIYSDHVGCISNSSIEGWKWYKMGLCSAISFQNLPIGYYILRILPSNNLLEVDEIVLDHDGNFNPSEVIESALCGNTKQLVASFTAENKCAGADVKFINLSGYEGVPCDEQSTYLWDFGGSTSTQKNPVHSFPNPGTYNVTLTVANSSGVPFSNTSANITLPVEIFASPTANAGSLAPGGYCRGKEVQLNGSATGIAPLTISWSPSSQLDDPTILTPKASPYNNTQYVLNVVDGNGCKAEDEVTMTIDPSLNPNVTTSITSSSVLECSTSPVTIEATATGGSGSYNYLWSPPNNLNSSTAQSTTINFPYKASALYTVTVTDANDCPATSNVFFQVDPASGVSCKHDGSDEEFIITDDAYGLKIYPNPFRNGTTIEYLLEEDAHVHVEIYTLLGELVQSIQAGDQPAGNYRFEYVASDANSSAIYILRMQVNNEVIVKRLVEMH